MRYQLEQGKTEKTIIEQCRKQKLPLPDKIANAPELHLGLELYYGAFFDLSTSRGGLGDGLIPWQAIEEYAILSEYDEEQKEALHFFITKMDQVYLKWKEKKNGKKSK